ncbi:restriction endonuclease subunit S [Methanoculleus chikugoensis]|uniref:restriction endonuclease subunit S n=1 Tax=Methanoculleus chikugoensis TaxID=118126 RepID=UPI000AAD4D4A|nr:restriction endonuclease subunit S [Methanoculleus chikugoensis]
MPEGWEWRRIRDFVKKVDSIDPTRSSTKRFCYIDIDSIDNSNQTIQNPKLITGKEAPSRARQIIKKDDILFSTVRPYLKNIALIDEIYDSQVASTGFCVIRVTEGGVDNKYLFYYLKSDAFLSELKRYYRGGANYPAISDSELLRQQFPLPPLETQRKIVAILEKAEATQRLRAEADALMQSLSESAFINLFGNPLENPSGWKVKRLEDVSEIVSGVTKGRKFKDQATIWVSYLRVANVQDGYLDLAEIKEIEVLESDVDKYALTPGGDVLLTEGGDRDKLGRGGAVWNGEVPLCLHQNHIFRVRVNPEFLTPEYLSMLTGSTYGKTYFLKSAKQTTGIASINSTQLKNFPTFLPPLELQYEFSEFVKRVEVVKRKQGSSKQRITMLFESLTNNVFSGEMTA